MNEQAPPEAVIVGGPNGAGKTTFAMEFLAEQVQFVYLSADAIAKELAPQAPEHAARAAGEEFLRRFDQLAASRANLLIESTLSGRSFRRALKRLKTEGYRLSIYFVFAASPSVAVSRVRLRVKKGGHNVPESDVLRRFPRSLRNFWNIYRYLADDWLLAYNSGQAFVDVAVGEGDDYIVANDDAFRIFQQFMD